MFLKVLEFYHKINTHSQHFQFALQTGPNRFLQKQLGLDSFHGRLWDPL